MNCYNLQMTDTTSAIIENSAVILSSEVPSASKRQRWFEVTLVLLVACSGAILNAVFVLINGPGKTQFMSNTRWIYGIVQEISSLLLLGYVLSRRRLRFRDLGLRWSFKDIGMGVLVTALSFAVYLCGAGLIYLFQYWVRGSLAVGPSGRDFFSHPSVAFIPFCFLNPFFEELIVRAYLMTEISDLTGSSILAVIISVAVQFSYHLYYGWAGAAALSFLFLTFALYYAKSRRALPVIVAHGIFDMSALIRIW